MVKHYHSAVSFLQSLQSCAGQFLPLDFAPECFVPRFQGGRSSLVQLSVKEALARNDKALLSLFCVGTIMLGHLICLASWILEILL